MRSQLLDRERVTKATKRKMRPVCDNFPFTSYISRYVAMLRGDTSDFARDLDFERMALTLQRQDRYAFVLVSGSFFFFFFNFRVAPAAYGGSRVRGRIRTVAAGLYHNHSNAG